MPRGKNLCTFPTLRDILFFILAKMQSLPVGRQAAKEGNSALACLPKSGY
jgi:hypothetical protein